VCVCFEVAKDHVSEELRYKLVVFSTSDFMHTFEIDYLLRFCCLMLLVQIPMGLRMEDVAN